MVSDSQGGVFGNSSAFTSWALGLNQHQLRLSCRCCEQAVGLPL